MARPFTGELLLPISAFLMRFVDEFFLHFFIQGLHAEEAQQEHQGEQCNDNPEHALYTGRIRSTGSFRFRFCHECDWVSLHLIPTRKWLGHAQTFLTAAYQGFEGKMPAEKGHFIPEIE
jgi:hypothetical protein